MPHAATPSDAAARGLHSTARPAPPRALLIALAPLGETPPPGSTPADMLDELEQLTLTLGLRTAAKTVVRIREPQNRYLVGTGKAEELAALAADSGAELIIFDDPLSPSQQRNWEKLAGKPVIDRQEVILDIFAHHARTRVAVLQVELARAQYDLPRLKRRWLHFSRQRGMRGGMMGRGAGEQQIEMDYRLVKRRIQQLVAELRDIVRSRELQRRRRQKRGAPVAAIVGYTNAGKSCLFNALTEAGVLVQDQLFATLDSTVRRLLLPGRQELLLSDTVGFVRKLPHQLVEAFKSTLEEVADADFLIEVLDVTNPAAEAHHATTCAVLKEMDAERLPVITVFNKMDLLPDPLSLHRVRRKHPDAVFVSARSGEGLDPLRERLAAQLAHTRRDLDLHLPPDRYDLLALLHRAGQVLEQEYVEDGIEVRAAVPLPACGPFLPFEKKSGRVLAKPDDSL